MHKLREREPPLPDLTPHQVGLISMMAQGARVLAMRFIQPEENDKPPAESYAYIQKVMGNIARRRLSDDILPIHEDDTGRLPKIDGIAPPPSSGDFPTMLGLMVASVGFGMTRGLQGTPPNVIEHNIITEGSAAAAFYVARNCGVSVDSEGAFCDSIRETVATALTRKDPVAFINAQKSFLTEPDPKSIELKSTFQADPDAAVLAKSTVFAYLLARQTVSEEAKALMQSMHDSVIEATTDDFHTVGSTWTEQRPRQIGYRRRCSHPGR